MATKKTSERKPQNEDEREWWRSVIADALDTEYARQTSPSWLASLSLQEIWSRSPMWISHRFQHFNQRLVTTGITQDMLRQSVTTCSYLPHQQDGLSEKYLPPAWLQVGSFEYTKEVKRSGLADMKSRQQTFLNGFNDCRGNQWCGFCAMRARMIDNGAALGFPDAHAIYPLPETSGVQGYAKWLQLARTAGHVLVETLANLAGEYKQVQRIA